MNDLLEVPLPVGWQLHTEVLCPVCGDSFFFDKRSQGKFEREMHCATQGCRNRDIHYWIEFTSESVSIVGVLPDRENNPVGRDGQEPELPEDEEKDEARRAPAP